MPRGFIDLHTHSTASDGSDSPTTLVNNAIHIGLHALALTDHDTFSGLEEAERASAGLGIEIIRGCELSTHSELGKIHLLGLWLPREANELQPLEQAMQQECLYRHERNVEIIERLRKAKILIDYTKVRARAGSEVVGRPHIAAELVALGAADNMKDAFMRYLGADGLAYVPRKGMLVEEGVALLAQVGATVAVAHPRLVRCGPNEMEALLTRLVPHGLSAVEAYHSEHSQADERFVVGVAQRLNLSCTGGSDYHGKAKPQVKLGSGHGRLRVTTHILEQLKKQRLAKGLKV